MQPYENHAGHEQCSRLMQPKVKLVVAEIKGLWKWKVEEFSLPAGSRVCRQETPRKDTKHQLTNKNKSSSLIIRECKIK